MRFEHIGIVVKKKKKKGGGGYNATAHFGLVIMLTYLGHYIIGLFSLTQ